MLNSSAPPVLSSKNPLLWLHPIPAACMISLDFADSLGKIISLVWFFLMPMIVIVIFGISALIVIYAQRRIAKDKPQFAVQKRFVIGILLAILLPIFGSIVGSYFFIKYDFKFHPLMTVYTSALGFTGSFGYLAGFLWRLPVPLAAFRIFIATSLIIAWLQHRIAGDELKQAFKKGMIAGLICAAPTPILGTAFGGYILLKSGMDYLKNTKS